MSVKQHERLYVSVMLSYSIKKKRLIKHFGFKSSDATKLKIQNLDDSTVQTFYEYFKSLDDE